jgi:hypothetical protein
MSRHHRVMSKDCLGISLSYEYDERSEGVMRVAKRSMSNFTAVQASRRSRIMNGPGTHLVVSLPLATFAPQICTKAMLQCTGDS